MKPENKNAKAIRITVKWLNSHFPITLNYDGIITAYHEFEPQACKTIR